MEELITQLKEMGFTEYEAKAYTALVQQSHVSAYQVSKNSGIPRARVYDILNILVEKGIVLKKRPQNKRPIRQCLCLCSYGKCNSAGSRILRL